MKYLLIALLLTGCAAPQGVYMSEADRATCTALAGMKAEDQCTVWSPEELRDFAKSFYLRGLQAGKRRTL